MTRKARTTKDVVKHIRKGMTPAKRAEFDKALAAERKRTDHALQCGNCLRIVAIFDSVDARCMAVDGPVTPTREEISDKELRAIYRLAKSSGSTRKRKS